MTYKLIVAIAEMLNNLKGNIEFETEAKMIAEKLIRFARFF